MNKKRLISALLVCCCLTILSVKADVKVIENQTFNGQGDSINNNDPGVFTVNPGDSLEITNSTFINNHGGLSGAIRNEGSLIINDGTADSHTTFEGNYNDIPSGGGGAINSYVAGSSVYIGDYTSFKGNRSDAIEDGGQAGGAIYIGNPNGAGTPVTKLEIGDYVEFNGNTANKGDSSMGGAIYIENTDTDIGDNFKVINNTSYKSGGAININCAASGQTAEIGKNAEFTGNTSTTGSGGAILNYDTDFTIGSGAEFTNNKAATSGGAISNSGKLTLEGAEFTGNSAERGGALYNAQNATANLTNVTVNAADDKGSNDIVNAGTTTTAGTNTFASDIKNESTGKINFSGTNTIDTTSKVTGSGEITNAGTLNLKGNAGEYTGKFSQTDSSAVTNVTGTFFNGENKIDKGALNIGSDTENGSLTLNTDSSVAGAVNMHIYEGSSLTLKGGSAVLDSADTWAGTVDMSTGTLTLNGLTSSEIGIIQATGGNLVIANGTNFSAKEGSSISGVNTQIEAGGTYAVTDGNSLTMGDSNKWEGTVSLQGGDFTVDGRKETTGNGVFTSNDNYKGSLNVINNGNLDIASGSNIAGAVTTKIETGSTVSIEGGEATLNSGDTWAGNVNLKSGTLTVNNVENGAINAAGGTLKLENQNFVVGEGSKIEAGTTVNINAGSSLTVAGGEATIDSGDKWDDSLVLNSGTLTIDNATQNSTIQANGGNLNIDAGSVKIGAESYIDAPANLDLGSGTTLNVIEQGIVDLNNGDTLDGTVTLNGGTINYGITNADASASLTANNGYLNLLENSNLTIQNPSTIADAVVVDIQKGATLTSGTSTTLNLNGGKDDASLNDKWNGTIVNDGGTINADNMISSGTSALIHTQGRNGVTNIDNYSQILLDSDVSKVEGGTVNVTNNSTLGMLDASNMHLCDLNVDSTSKFVSYDNAFDLYNLNHAGLLIGQNNALEDYNISQTMNIGSGNDNQADFTIDVYGRSNATDEHGSDRFFADIIKNNSTNGEPAVVNISDWSLGGDIFGWDAPIDKHINLDQIFNYNTLDGNVEFNVTDKEVFTPIGWYKLNGAPNSPGGMTLDLTRFNPQVYRGQVTTIAQWMNQLAINDMLFNHSMVLPSFKEEDGGIAYGGMMANRYAAIDPQFAPYQYSRKDGGLWYKMYGTFETLQMSQGLSNVGNNAYGSIIGADFGLKELKNGWKFMPTAYIGYNGAHQYYSGLGAYQNGGQAGFLGTWYKNNFIIGGLVYGGVYQNSMDIAGHTDNTFNYFAGAATKAAYNWRFHRDWVLQPNLLLAYNFFGQQNWHSDFGQMGMMSGILNGINLAPGLNLIWEKETFSIYATLQYMYNVNGAVGGRAGNVSLPHLDMDRGYIQYGIGFTKRFTDRFSGYFQTVFRNVGRTGVGFQLGFNWLIGK